MTKATDDKPKKRMGRPPLPPAERERRKRERYKKKLIQQRAKRAEEAEMAQRGRVADREEKVRDVLREAGPELEERKKLQGPGRPKGTLNIYSYESVRKLETLGFDPIEKMVELYAMIIGELYATELDKEGQTRYVVKRGSLAHTQLLTQLKGISDTLIKYGYRAVPEKRIEEDIENREPTIIQLSFAPPAENQLGMPTIDITPKETVNNG